MKKNRVYSNVEVALIINETLEDDFQKILSEIDLMFDDDCTCKELKNIIEVFMERKERENENDRKF